MLRYLFATPLVIFVALLVIGSLTGRVKMRSCCGAPPPERDLRLRTDESTTTGTSAQAPPITHQ
jgi:hypothetical protein